MSAESMRGSLGSPYHHRKKENQQDKMEKSGGQVGRVAISGILVNQGLRKVKLEGEERNEGVRFPVSVKIENEWRASANDATSGEGLEEDDFTVEFGVTKQEVRSPSPARAEDLGEEGQKFSCSCQEEIESLKCTVRQLTLQMEIQNKMITKQNEVVTGMKTCIRNVALSMLTCCKDEKEGQSDLPGDNESEEFSERGKQPLPDNVPLKNSQVTANGRSEATGDNLQDEEEQCSLSTTVKCTSGRDTSSLPIPRASFFLSSASSETCSNEVGYTIGRRTNEEEAIDIGHVNFQEDDHEDSSYIPDESEMESDQEMDDENNYHGADISSSKSVKTKSGFECWKCRKSFNHKKYLLKHMRRVHVKNVSTSECPLCKKVFGEPWYLKQHIQSAHEGVRYKCAYCPGKFTRLSQVRRHERNVHKDGGRPTQKCEICGIHLQNCVSLNIHMSKMHKEAEFTRERIQRLLEDKKPAIATTRTILFQCQMCSSSFPERAELHSHQRWVHGIDTNLGREAEK